MNSVNYNVSTALALLFLVSCSTTTHQPSTQDQDPSSDRITSAVIFKNGGGYYLDDGPGSNPPDDLHLVPDAVPKTEPLRKANMRPYVALGNSYKPMTKLEPYKERGVASWYGRRYHGNKTASGEAYDMYAMTAAHPTLPLPSYARVTNVTNGKSIVVRINDRGPFLANRLIDLSYTAAYKLEILQNGRGEVEVESILPDSSVNVAQQTNTRPIETATQLSDNSDNINEVYLQLGAFGTVGNAHNFLSHVQKELPWLSHTVSISEINGLYRIKAGPYTNLILAQQVADSINQQLLISPIILID